MQALAEKWLESVMRPKQVLVVDDDALIRTLFRCMEPAFNIQIDYAKTVAEATSFLSTKNYDYIFLDMHLDMRLSGMDVLHLVNSTQNNTRVTIMSGSVNLHDIMHESNRLGVMSFILKPTEFTVAYLMSIFIKLGLQPSGAEPGSPDFTRA